MTDTENRIHKTIQHFTEVARIKGYEFPKCVIDYSLKGATAGYAFRRSHKMRFNLALAERHMDQFLVSTVPHEMAHILQFTHYPHSKPHGHEWNHFCKVLTGATMPRCHNYDVTGIKRTRNTKQYKYSCDCASPHIVSSVKHNKMLRGDRYRCRGCKGILRRIIATI